MSREQVIVNPRSAQPEEIGANNRSASGVECTAEVVEKYNL